MNRKSYCFVLIFTVKKRKSLFLTHFILNLKNTNILFVTPMHTHTYTHFNVQFNSYVFVDVIFRLKKVGVMFILT